MLFDLELKKLAERAASLWERCFLFIPLIPYSYRGWVGFEQGLGRVLQIAAHNLQIRHIDVVISQRGLHIIVTRQTWLLASLAKASSSSSSSSSPPPVASPMFPVQCQGKEGHGRGVRVGRGEYECGNSCGAIWVNLRRPPSRLYGPGVYRSSNRAGESGGSSDLDTWSR
jgi:hypothetical protein